MPDLNTTKCPYCAEEIKAEAIKCKHCGEWMETIKQFTSENHIPCETASPKLEKYKKDLEKAKSKLEG